MKFKLKAETAIFKALAKRVAQINRDIPDFFRKSAAPMIRDGLTETFLEHSNRWRAWSFYYQRDRGKWYAKGKSLQINASSRRKVVNPPEQPEYIGRLTGTLFRALTSKRATLGAHREFGGRNGKNRVMYWGVRTDGSSGIPYAPKFNNARQIRIHSPIGDTMRRAARTWIVRKMSGKTVVKVKV